jgi:glycosyltransferase involved in cell wall biosynthesis
LRVLLWHVHGSWTTAFVQGGHEYVVPVLRDRGPDGRGRAETYPWPDSVVEATPDELRDLDVDVVVLQRPHEPALVERWLGRRPGVDVPAVYVEHNTPLHGEPDVPDTRHPLADQDRVPIAHVTGFNDLFWDCGAARTVVIEHGVVDPGLRYTGELERAAVVVNDPLRRGRSVGTDLIPTVARAAPVDVFGMRVAELPRATGLGPESLAVFEDLPQDRMHDALARRRVYVHLSRWTSLGLSLIEAMHLGMPMVVLATTEAPVAVPPGAGVLTTRRDELVEAVAELVGQPERARAAGEVARAHALERFGLGRFLADWDQLLKEVVTG